MISYELSKYMARIGSKGGSRRALRKDKKTLAKRAASASWTEAARRKRRANRAAKKISENKA